jgi:hypothetical protein
VSNELDLIWSCDIQVHDRHMIQSWESVRVLRQPVNDPDAQLQCLAKKLEIIGNVCKRGRGSH